MKPFSWTPANPKMAPHPRILDLMNCGKYERRAWADLGKCLALRLAHQKWLVRASPSHVFPGGFAVAMMVPLRNQLPLGKMSCVPRGEQGRWYGGVCGRPGMSRAGRAWVQVA